MKKITVLISLLSITFICSAASPKKSKYDVVKENFYDKEVHEDKSISFNGKDYKLIYNEEYEDDSWLNDARFGESWNCTAEPDNWTSYETKKLYGTKKDWKKVQYCGAQKGKNYYAKDGVCYLVNTREFDEATKTWIIGQPYMEVNRDKVKITYGTVTEIKFKMSTKGKETLYQIFVSPINSYKNIPNENGYFWKIISCLELLSGKKNTLAGACGGWFLGKKVPAGTASGFMQADMPKGLYEDDFTEEYALGGIVVQTDRRKETIKIDDEHFDEWHTFTLRYDEKGIYQWFDGELICWYPWDRTGELAEELRENYIHITVSTGGDYNLLPGPHGEPVGYYNKFTGKFDDDMESFYMGIDSIKIYKRINE